MDGMRTSPDSDAAGIGTLVPASTQTTINKAQPSLQANHHAHSCVSMLRLNSMRKVKHPALEALGVRYPTSITVNACRVALSRSSRFDVGRSLSFARARPAVPYCTCEDDQPEDHDDDDHDVAS